jgi:hypothetical protein
MEPRRHEEGVGMVFVHTACSNIGAIKLFRLMGYGKPEAEVWPHSVSGDAAGAAAVQFLPHR